MAYGARLESVLGASPRGFESPILRRLKTCSDQDFLLTNKHVHCADVQVGLARGARPTCFCCLLNLLEGAVRCRLFGRAVAPTNSDSPESQKFCPDPVLRALFRHCRPEIVLSNIVLHTLLDILMPRVAHHQPPYGGSPLIVLRFGWLIDT